MAKKWKDWPNIINQAGPHHVVNMVARSAADHKHDKKPHHTHVRGFKGEMGKKRLHRGDLIEGHTHKHLDKGYRTEPLMGDHPTHSLKGMY